MAGPRGELGHTKPRQIEVGQTILTFMRFLENGPNIPRHLLEQQALGNVIFFCGAGISLQAGLPDFGGLTCKLISGLRAEKAKKALDDGEGLDRVFRALVEEFGFQEIDRQIYLALKTPNRPKLQHHKTILELSLSPTGNPQIVTTNFDLLFERASPGIRRFVPPSLPEIALGDNIQGVVYLHGRLAKPNGHTKAGYVISSADFGRAYLAEGWAARFVRAIRESYTIVLLGYSANDPPMRYLLEGLHSREHTRYDSPIYAFASGSPGEIEEQWRDKGVTPIAYAPLDKDHSGLWDTLSQWGSTSVDPESWNSKVVALAQKYPSELKPYERGQVVNLISSKAGAKLFLEASPPPPAEWLCVFDRKARYSETSDELFVQDSSGTDLHTLFSLDDDPSRPAADSNRQIMPVGIDYLNWMSGDTAFPEQTRLATSNQAWANQLPERLHYLAYWIGAISHEPAAVWWASGFASLHPTLLSFIRNHVYERPQFPDTATKFWELFIEANHGSKIDDRHYQWFEFKKIVKKNGWSPYTLRAFERILEPQVVFKRYPHGVRFMSKEGWQELPLSKVVEMKVRVLDRHNTGEPIPNEHLPRVVEIIRESLARTAQLLGEVETIWWRTPTFHPTGHRGEIHHTRKESLLFWFISLFDTLRSTSLAAAKNEIRAWDRNDPFFFGKLCLFVHMDANLTTANEAATVLTNIRDEIFWDSYNHRELLFTLRARWKGFNSRQQRSIERRIIRGAPRSSHLKAADYRRRKASIAASMLRWLQLNNCDLTPKTEALLPKLKTVDPRWTDEWALVADNSRGPRGGFVETIRELRGLDELPIGSVIAAADKGSEDDHNDLRSFRPFEGFVKEYPFRALSSLRFEARRSNYPIRYWQNLLSDWPDNVPSKLRWFLAHTLTKIPDQLAHELRYYVPRWLKENLRKLAEHSLVSALTVFDSILTKYTSAPPETMESSRGTTTIGGVAQKESEVSYAKAINSPSGVLTECLFSLSFEKSTSGTLPEHFESRLENLFALPGNAGRHAVCVTTVRIAWLDNQYRNWSNRALIPLFGIENEKSEAAWHGWACDQQWLSGETLKLISRDFAKILIGKSSWSFDKDEYRYCLHRFIYMSRKVDKKPPIFSFDQVRTVLTAIDADGRAEILTALTQAISREGEWTNFVKPIIEHAWPRQLKYRSEETSRAFARLITESRNDFPDAVSIVVPLLIPIPDVEMTIYRMLHDLGDNKIDLAKCYPDASLSLLDVLIADDRRSTPHELSRVLGVIGEANPALRQSAAWRRLRDLSG